jgi:small subunit ribosomal protein S6
LLPNPALAGQKGAGDQKEVTRMNKYELCVVVNAKIEEEERTSTINKVKELVEKYGGQIADVDEWGKKRLAYEIQKMREGYYYFIHFEAESTTPAEIESRIRIMDNVIRYLCVKQEK